MRARGVGRADRVDNRHVLLVEQRFQRSERGMQAEKSVEIDGTLAALVGE
jgi:hypothetical protein